MEYACTCMCVHGFMCVWGLCMWGYVRMELFVYVHVCMGLCIYGVICINMIYHVHVCMGLLCTCVHVNTTLYMFVYMYSCTSV